MWAETSHFSTKLEVHESVRAELGLLVLCSLFNEHWQHLVIDLKYSSNLSAGVLAYASRFGIKVFILIRELFSMAMLYHVGNNLIIFFLREYILSSRTMPLG